MGLVKQLRLRLRVLPGLRRCREVCSTVDAMRRNKNIPVFFAHGDADDFVPVAMPRKRSFFLPLRNSAIFSPSFSAP